MAVLVILDILLRLTTVRTIPRDRFLRWGQNSGRCPIVKKIITLPDSGSIYIFLSLCFRQFLITDANFLPDACFRIEPECLVGFLGDFLEPTKHENFSMVHAKGVPTARVRHLAKLLNLCPCAFFSIKAPHIIKSCV